jgi:signal transduction histidine kinase
MAVEPSIADNTSLSPSKADESGPHTNRSSKRFVTLRLKTIVLLACTILGLFLALYIPLRIVVLGSYLDLESQQTTTEVSRANDALQSAISRVSNTAAGYATWDDTYKFVQDRNDLYMRANLADPSFPAEDINLVMIVDTEHQVIGAKAYDLVNERSVDVPSFFLSPQTLESFLFDLDEVKSSVSGIVMLNDGPMLVAAQPILTSDGEGPVRGTLLMGRYLDEILGLQIAESLHLDVQFHRIDQGQTLEAGELSSSATAVQILSESRIAGVRQVDDVFGQPALAIQVELPRAIYAQGRVTVDYFTLALIAVAMVSLGVTVLGLEWMVLARIGQLDARAHTIGESGDVSLRMEVDGNDELSRLSQSINGMLAAIDQAEQTRRGAEEVRARTQEELLRSREQFSQMLVHDLKNPLMGVKGYADMLSRMSLDTTQRELAEGIQRSNAATLNLVTQLLDIARLSEGRLELRCSNVDVRKLLHECAHEMSSWAKIENKAIRINVSANFPLIYADEGLIRRVILNLTSNAIKHTPYATEITLGAEMVNGKAEIFVHDTGPGISPEVKQRLFERFASSNEHTSYHSTGLGLTFCKLAVEAHDGTISVASSQATGTTFTLHLPVPVVNQAAMPTLPKPVTTVH